MVYKLYYSLPAEMLCCVLEQDTFFSFLVLVPPRKTHPDITKKCDVTNQTKQKNFLLQSEICLVAPVWNVSR